MWYPDEGCGLERAAVCRSYWSEIVRSVRPSWYRNLVVTSSVVQRVPSSPRIDAAAGQGPADGEGGGVSASQPQQRMGQGRRSWPGEDRTRLWAGSGQGGSEQQ